MPTKKRRTASPSPAPAVDFAEPVAPVTPAVPEPTPVEATVEITSQDAPATEIALETVALTDLKHSPYLAAGRLPATNDMEAVIERLGGIAAICTEKASIAVARLTPQEHDFLLLVLSIYLHGVLEPPTVRRTEQGLEIVTGHRRVLAAMLAGRTVVAVRYLEGLDDRTAAAAVAQSNETHVGLSAWQRLRLVLAVRALLLQHSRQAPAIRRGRGRPEREDGASQVAPLLAMPYSTAKMYVSISEALTDQVLAKVGPELGATHAALAQLPLGQLRALAKIKLESDRIAAIKALIAGEPRTAHRKPSRPGRTPFQLDRSESGFTLRVGQLDTLDKPAAWQLLQFLEEETARVAEHYRQLLVADAEARIEQKALLKAA